MARASERARARRARSAPCGQPAGLSGRQPAATCVTVCFNFKWSAGLWPIMRFRARLHVHAAPLRPRVARWRDSASTELAHAAAHAAKVGGRSARGHIRAACLLRMCCLLSARFWSATRSTGRALLT